MYSSGFVPPRETLRVTIHTDMGYFTCSTFRDITVREFLSVLRARNIVGETSVLLYMGFPLEYDKTMGSYGITNGSLLELGSGNYGSHHQQPSSNPASPSSGPGRDAYGPYGFHGPYGPLGYGHPGRRPPNPQRRR